MGGGGDANGGEVKANDADERRVPALRASIAFWSANSALTGRANRVLALRADLVVADLWGRANRVYPPGLMG